ncbi:MAG: ATP synthase subunit I [Lachnospiraceae bacterium]|nr:ATP synthase subunit I [Lachnospiraceae bacterium]
MFGRRKQPRLRDVMKEMSYGGTTELRDPEDIDRELSEEEAEAEEENRVVDPIEEESERAYEELREAEAVHTDLKVGCVALCVLLLLGMIWARPVWKYAAGVAVGAVVAVYLLVHMYRSIGWALTMDPQRAERYTRGRSAIRYAVVLLSVVAVMVGLGRTAGIGCILSIIMIKPAAYLQPFTAKLRRKMGLR